MEGVWVRGEEEGMDGLGSWFGWMDGGKGCAGFTLSHLSFISTRD